MLEQPENPVHPAEADSEPLFHMAFYTFVALPEPEPVAAALEAHIKSCGVYGSILVATEGINGMLAGTKAQLDEYQHALETGSYGGPAFTDMVIKRTHCTTMPFRKQFAKVKDEIVPLGVEINAPARVADIKATDVPPAQWRELITRDDVVLIDNRNSYEFEVGRFEGAIDPGIENFRDFADYVQDHADEWKTQGKKVAMYCTGGIRCEKSSPWMQDLGLEVYQLEGGILNYFQQMQDPEHDWHGDCFIFDDRRALTTTCEPVAHPERIATGTSVSKKTHTAPVPEVDPTADANVRPGGDSNTDD